jgi:hypothetical protein
MSLTEQLRKMRKIVGDVSVLESSHVAFLGLHNPSRHLDSIHEWISRVEADGSPLLVVDNSSPNEVLDVNVLKTWTGFDRVVYVRNPMNLGGFGSLSTNLDLLSKAAWVTTFHQDDQYSPKHLKIHRELVASGNSELGMVSSEQESFMPNGKRLGYPRASWFLGEETDPISLFLANLRHHTLPFSGATFRLEMLRSISIPWHSTSFPDTEIVLKMLPRWKGLVTSRVIVKYLENSDSESHSIQESERDFGASMALARVFSSAGFGQICNRLGELEIAGFVTALTDGVSHRLRSTAAARETAVLALEIMLDHLGPHSSIVARLEPYYSSIGASAASKLLHELHSFGEPGKSSSGEGCASVIASNVTVYNNGRISLKGQAANVVAKLMGYLPRGVRVVIWKIAMKFLGFFGVKTAWTRDRL